MHEFIRGTIAARTIPGLDSTLRINYAIPVGSRRRTVLPTTARRLLLLLLLLSQRSPSFTTETGDGSSLSLSLEFEKAAARSLSVQSTP